MPKLVSLLALVALPCALPFLPWIDAESDAVARADLDGLAELAVSADSETARRAIERLRDAGPEGLDRLLARHAPALDAVVEELLAGRVDAGEAATARLLRAVDGVGAAHDNFAARLYWHTDLERAKALARRTSRPILSLRLLGRLDEARSCANSRFFRTALYPNEALSALLRERFVLHWESMRPVPQLSVDLGDGRRIERTLTGNSAHYVLDAQGRPFDVIPGLLVPDEFARRIAAAADALARALGTDFAAARRVFHQGRAGRSASRGVGIVAPSGTAAPTGIAAEAMERTISKSAVESPVLAALASAPAPAVVPAEPSPRIAVTLDRRSRAVIAKHVGAGAAGGELRARFEGTLWLDSALSAVVLHDTLHAWFAAGWQPADLAELDERVYAELFRTPLDDPWMGLADPADYAALDGNGLSRR